MSLKYYFTRRSAPACLKLVASCEPDSVESVQLQSRSPAAVALALREAVAERNCDLVCPSRNAGGTTRSGKSSRARGTVYLGGCSSRPPAENDPLN